MTCQNKSVHNVYKSWSKSRVAFLELLGLLLRDPCQSVVTFQGFSTLVTLRIPELKVSGFQDAPKGQLSILVFTDWQRSALPMSKGETVGVSLGELGSFSDFSASSPRGPNSTSNIIGVKYQNSITKHIDLFF